MTRAAAGFEDGVELTRAGDGIEDGKRDFAHAAVPPEVLFGLGDVGEFRRVHHVGDNL